MSITNSSKILKINKIRAISYLYPKDWQIRPTTLKALQINRLGGAGRGNRTPMKSPSPDFESGEAFR